MAEYDVRVSRVGLEADDMMCLYQTSHENTIICSRDKDLRICPGWHFSWECGGQKAIGPVYTDELGSINLVKKNGVNTIVGYGLKFFFSQMITGDSADNIPGLPKQGAAKAYKVLAECVTEEEMFKATQNLYKEVMGDDAKDYFQEMKALLWMKQTDKWEYKYG
jgi:5'-3' exonuclease